MPSFCINPGCSNDKKRRPGLRFCRVPKGITNQGKQSEFFSTDRRTKWLAAICTVSCPISGHFLQNCSILPQNSTNELKFSHNVTSTAGIKVGREVSSPEALWFLCNYGKIRSSSVTYFRTGCHISGRLLRSKYSLFFEIFSSVMAKCIL